MEPDLAVDFLNAYVAHYISEENQQKALARDAVVARPTVNGYFAMLVDTLLGALVPAWRTPSGSEVDFT